MRRMITLIEVLVVLALLSLLGGVLAYGLSTAIRQQTFEAGVTTVLNRLQMAQDIMMIAGGDVRVNISRNPEGISFRLETAQPLDPLLERQIQQAGVVNGITKFLWTTDNTVEDTTAVLSFLSLGARMSKGTLTLSNGTSERFIVLTGLPQPFTELASDVQQPPPVAEDFLMERLYPSDVRYEEK